MKRRNDGTKGSFARPWMLGCALMLMTGCEGPQQDNESLWLGVIDPSMEEALKGDDLQEAQAQDETLSNETPAPVALTEETSKTDERPEEESTDISGHVALAEAESPDESEPESEASASPEIPSLDSENADDEVPVEWEEENEEAEAMQSSDGTEMESTSEESVVNQGEAVVKFVADFSCTAGVHEEHVYVLGMDKWNEEWAIAVHLERVEDSHHYEGSWVGAGGDYTFLMSHGKMEANEVNPWDEVEEIEGQSCSADTYGNRGLRAHAGETITVEITFGFCDGCPATCAGSCGGTSVTGDCFCDALCEEYGDCCSDFLTVCAPTSCQGQCGGKHDSSNCYCDDSCSTYNDCCGDFQEVCGD